MNLTLKVWRQKDAEARGRFETYEAKEVLPDMSFLEMLDVVNEGLIARGEEPIAFDSDCREGICGMCSLVINGIAHGGPPSSPGERRPFPSSKIWLLVVALLIASFRLAGSFR